MNIKFTINKELAIEAVKTETFLKGTFDKAAIQGGEKVAYFETAGDLTVHERKLEKDFVNGVEELKSILVTYFVPDHSSVGDTCINSSFASNGDATMVIELQRRLNGTIADALANYSQRYVESFMAYKWWVSISNQTQAAPFATELTDLAQRILNVFVLSSPLASTAKYSDVNGGIYLDDGTTEFNGTNA